MKLTDKAYNELSGIRRSDLWMMHKSPAHFYYNYRNKSEPTKELLFGIAAHKIILEYDEFMQTYTVMPQFDRRTKQGKADYETYLMLHENYNLITQEDWDKLFEMRKEILDDPIASKLIKGSQHEEVFVWSDPETEELCKMKADIVSSWDGLPILVDYKTTTSCEDGAFERSIRKYGYKFQAGMYVEGYEANTFEACRFAFIAQEKTAPYAVRVYWCSDEFVEAGKLQFHNLLRRYHNCNQNREWPGYTDVELLEESYD